MVTIFTPIGRCGPGMRINVRNDIGSWDSLTCELFDNVSSQVMCAGGLQFSSFIPSGSVVTPILGTVSNDGTLLPLGDPIVGLADNAALDLHVNFRNGGIINDSAVVSGYHWDAVSGAWNLWQLISSGAAHDTMLDTILAAVRRDFG